MRKFFELLAPAGIETDGIDRFDDWRRNLAERRLSNVIRMFGEHVAVNVRAVDCDWFMKLTDNDDVNQEKVKYELCWGSDGLRSSYLISSIAVFYRSDLMPSSLIDEG